MSFSCHFFSAVVLFGSLIVTSSQMSHDHDGPNAATRNNGNVKWDDSVVTTEDVTSHNNVDATTSSTDKLETTENLEYESSSRRYNFDLAKEDGLAKLNDTDQRRMHVVGMMRHAWTNYKLYAWGKNELKPISKRAPKPKVYGRKDLGATIVEALDTLYIMGLMDEFQEGRDWVAENLNILEYESELSVFETTVRFIGGLLSCYAFTGDTMFRDKAASAADGLLPAFDTPTGLPYSLINPSTKVQRLWSRPHVILSEVGSLHLEFTYLSDVTGNDVYRQKVQRIREVLQKSEKINGLYPNHIDPLTGAWGRIGDVTLGAYGDSFYDYLLKAWLMSGKQDIQARTMFDTAMEAALDKLLKTSPEGLTYLAELKYGRVIDKMDHLACFAGGMFALASTTLENASSKHYMDVAEKLTHTCHENYDRTETKLGPEVFSFSEAEARNQKSYEKEYHLRPQVIQTYLVMWRLTGDQKYREWGWEVVQALEKYCRVEGGYTGIYNVFEKNPVGEDLQQSYFLAATLKYLYLLFADDSVIPLDQWVFNTEAHPLPIRGANNLYREKP